MPSGARGGPGLSTAQHEALAHIRARAGSRTAAAETKIADMLGVADSSRALLAAAMNTLQEHAQVALHFHPDRLTNSNKTVAEGLLTDGIYRSQFETGISNGSPTAFSGGARDEWERCLFGEAYHSLPSADAERPKYGSMLIHRYADGPSPRFGSCYFVLHPAVSRRCTFTYGDSHTEPEQVGTIDTMTPILAAACADIKMQAATLGMYGLTVHGFLNYLCHEIVRPRPDPARGTLGRVLDDYIEAQVHGPIDLQADVQRLVADPSFRGTPTGAQLEAMCKRYDILLQWHPGFVLPATSVPADFRGPTLPPLARRIAEIAGTDMLDAAVLGVGAESAYRRPDLWNEWGCWPEVLRRFRQMWHVLVRFGTPKQRP